MSNEIATFKCEIVKKEFKFVGISKTAPFPSAFPEAAIKVQQEFWERRKTIENAVNNEILFSPSLCNGIIATYFACLEVFDIQSIPDGMIGFTLPFCAYAKISCTNKTIGEGYNNVFHWMEENGYKQKNDKACQMEVFYIDELAEEELVEILIPIESE